MYLTNNITSTTLNRKIAINNSDSLFVGELFPVQMYEVTI